MYYPRVHGTVWDSILFSLSSQSLARRWGFYAYKIKLDDIGDMLGGLGDKLGGLLGK